MKYEAVRHILHTIVRSFVCYTSVISPWWGGPGRDPSAPNRLHFLPGGGCFAQMPNKYRSNVIAVRFRGYTMWNGKNEIRSQNRNLQPDHDDSIVCHRLRCWPDWFSSLPLLSSFVRYVRKRASFFSSIFSFFASRYPCIIIYEYAKRAKRAPPQTDRAQVI